ncbi:GxxExxY protein, partial [Candidatus Falkowbacteria bacterium]|nr:GxxExxY protein [Candidatus Falkowbacteria bacterium]
IYSFRTGKVLGKYIPDFIIDDKIIVEIKAVGYIPKNIENQLLDYLKNGKYELGYIINFSGRSLYRRRFICTNNRKDFINH